jgi:hypothetical protein
MAPQETYQHHRMQAMVRLLNAAVALDRDERYRSGSRMKRAGIGVLAGGLGVSGVLALIAWAYEGDVICKHPDHGYRVPCYDERDGQTGNATAMALGITAAVLASVSLGAGIPMAVVGNNRMKEARERIRRATAAQVPGGASGPAGLGGRRAVVSLRWTF